MPDIRVVGVGSALLDILVRLERMPTWDDPVDLLDLEIDGGGPVATALVAVERLGVRAGIVGTYGTHRVGQIKLQTLAEHGVDVSRMVPRPGRRGHTDLHRLHRCRHGRARVLCAAQPGPRPALAG